MQNNWLEVWYQPKFDLKSMAVCGAEALIRLRHPKHGMMPPSAFLPPAGDPLYRRLRPKLALAGGVPFAEDDRLRWHPSLAPLKRPACGRTGSVPAFVVVSKKGVESETSMTHAAVVGWAVA